MTLTWPDLPVAQAIPWPDGDEVAAVAQVLRGSRVWCSPPTATCSPSGSRRGARRGFRPHRRGLRGDLRGEHRRVHPARLRTVLQMAVVLTYGGSLPVVKIGRMAGQYFKPRSKPVEIRDGVELPSYYGDAVNALPFEAGTRRPDAHRLLRVYQSSGAALNLIRSFMQDGSADLRQVHAWNRDFVRFSPAGQRYDSLAADIDRALAFMSACGASRGVPQRRVLRGA